MIQPLFLFKIAGLPFFSYTLLISLGLAAAYIAALPRLRRIGRTAGDGAEAMMCMVVPALIFGRLAHVLYNFSYFSERPMQIWWFADGGFGMVGIALGAASGLFGWSRTRGARFIDMADAAAFPIALLATAAWLGALLHGSQYGLPENGVFSLELRDEFGVVMPRWPSQLLAAGWTAFTAVCVFAVGENQGKTGWNSGIFLLCYSIGLFFIDFTRADPSVYILGLRATQWLYVVAFGIGIFNLGRSQIRA